MTAATATDPSTLLQHNGHVVPWVTRWTGEVSTDMIQVSLDRRAMPGSDSIDELVVGYEDGLENREPSGFLWQREGITRKGEPQYAEINTYRQRAAMRRRLCQVCGNKIQDKVIPWLLATDTMDHTEDGTVLTMSAPTCAGCVPVALDLCPHLKQPGAAQIARVLQYRIWGVYGEGMLFKDGKTKRVQRVYIANDRIYKGLSRRAVVAKQQVVELTKFTLEDV